MEKRIIRTWISKHDDLFDAYSHMVRKQKHIDKLNKRNPNLKLDIELDHVDIKYTLWEAI